MRLKSARIRNFKRFVDLSIQGLPPDVKLVVLLGPNGCGKSSLFDAFQSELRIPYLFGMNPELERYYRRASVDVPVQNHQVDLEFHGGPPTSAETYKGSLYLRSAYRHEASFTNTKIQQQPTVLDRPSVRRLIDTDQTVKDNYERIAWRLLEQVTTSGLTTDSIMEATIGDLQRSLETVFGDICLDAFVANPQTGTFTFSKGASKNFLYESLSAGEKAAFDLLLDVVVNRRAFDPALYCIDEPEAHLGTRLQGRLLEELCRLVPGDSQLWLATHSIGMVRTAQAIGVENPGQVVFLDLGFGPDGEARDFDKPQTIEPAVPDYAFWSRHYGVALDDVADLLAPDCIVLCEGSTTGDEPALDETCYNAIFVREFPRTRFVSVGPVTKVEKRLGDLLPLLERIVGGTSVIRFRDRDDVTLGELEDKQAEGVRVMSAFRNLESLLLSDGVLSRLCALHERADCFDEVRKARDDALTRARARASHPSDDLRPAVQAVHHAAKSTLGLDRPGGSKYGFLRYVLAPLVTEDTLEYRQLKRDIFGS